MVALDLNNDAGTLKGCIELYERFSWAVEVEQ
jgi:hypothetical protein